MADGSHAVAISLKGKVSEEEWNTRVQLAALYRLVALHGWDDLIFTHISARLPGPDHQFPGSIPTASTSLMRSPPRRLVKI